MFFFQAGARAGFYFKLELEPFFHAGAETGSGSFKLDLEPEPGFFWTRAGFLGPESGFLGRSRVF